MKHILGNKGAEFVMSDSGLSLKKIIIEQGEMMIISSSLILVQFVLGQNEELMGILGPNPDRIRDTT